MNKQEIEEMNKNKEKLVSMKFNYDDTFDEIKKQVLFRVDAENWMEQGETR